MFKAYKNYWLNTFKYRATSNRADFWWPVLVNVIIYAILALLISVSGAAFIFSTAVFNGLPSGLGAASIFIVLAGLFAFANIFPEISIMVRRLRDAGLTGWTLLVFWLLTGLLDSSSSNFWTTLSSILGIIMLVFLCLPSNYVYKHGWWSPNTSDDNEVPSLRNE